MRLIIGVVVVLAGVGLYVATADRDGGISSLPPPTTPPAAEMSLEAENQVSVQPVDELLPEPDEPAIAPSDERPEVINIGEPMDPDDPSTWPQPENTEVINIGKPMDPDDPSTWDQ